MAGTLGTGPRHQARDCPGQCHAPGPQLLRWPWTSRQRPQAGWPEPFGPGCWSSTTTCSWPRRWCSRSSNAALIARFAVPATLQHVSDAIAWNPDLAVLHGSLEGDPVLFVTILQEAGIPVAVRCRAVTGEVLVRCRDGGAYIVDHSEAPLEALLRAVELLALPLAQQASHSALQAAPNSNPSRLGPFAILTPREKKVLADLMDGLTAETIARRNCVAVSTVRSQIKSILQKLGVNSQLAAVAFARRAGWSYPSGQHPPAPRRPASREDDFLAG